MNSNLQFDFLVDKENKTVDLVWQAWTDVALLDQWWAPQPWTSKTKYMNFTVGGRRFYAMVSPEGQEHWSIQEYTYISPKTNFKYLSAFADKDENPSLPGSNWDLSFSEQQGTTVVTIVIYNESRDRMDMMLEMGFKEGFTSILNYLNTFLITSNKKV